MIEKNQKKVLTNCIYLSTMTLTKTRKYQKQEDGPMGQLVEPGEPTRGSVHIDVSENVTLRGYEGVIPMKGRDPQRNSSWKTK